MAWSSTGYSLNAQKFATMAKEIEAGTAERHGVTVLECFAGIGSFTLALKRLGIKIDRGVLFLHGRVLFIHWPLTFCSLS